MSSTRLHSKYYIQNYQLKMVNHVCIGVLHIRFNGFKGNGIEGLNNSMGI